MNSAEIAYIAGIVEGEGWIGFRLSKKKYHYPRLVVEMTDRAVVSRCRRIAQCGFLLGPYTRKGARAGHKPTWQWTVSNRAEIYKLCRAIYPWLAARRRAQIRRVLTCYR